MREEEGQKFAGFHFSSVLSDDIKNTIKWAGKIQNGNFKLVKEEKNGSRGGSAGGLLDKVVGSVLGSGGNDGNGGKNGGSSNDAPVETRDTADGASRYLSGGARELDGVRIEVESYSAPDL